MFRVCSCNISSADADRLANSIEASGAIEVAAAIRFASRSDLAVEILEPEIRDAVAKALERAPAGDLGTLSCLRDALDSGCC